jgi:hypothetical protein
MHIFIDFSKRLQACNYLTRLISRAIFAEKRKTMVRRSAIQAVAPATRRGVFQLPDEGGSVSVRLNPIERTLLRLFIAHPEGIAADNLLRYWQELCRIYARESRYDEPNLREIALESLCAESKTVFYSNVCRIKQKFVAAVGKRKATRYIIRRYPDGLYRTRATLAVPDG